MTFVLVANPANRRVAFFQAAVARAGLPPARVVPWLELVTGRADLAATVAGAPGGAILRFDSAGEDDEVERALIALGADAVDPQGDEGMAPRIPAQDALALPVDRGRILHPRQAYLGLVVALERAARALEAAPPRALLNHPHEIAVHFDKRACHARLLAAGVPVPPALGRPDDRVRGWDDLRARMAAAEMPRVFVKLASGSSASGVVALETRRGAVLAHTTATLTRGAGGEVVLHNALRVRRYTDEADVAAIVDALCREGAHVEAWIPKARVEGRAFDLRVVVIDGSARQVVARTSASPMTNLHLGNQRGDLEQVRARLGERAWSSALAAAEAALAAFPRTRYAGVDVLVSASRRRTAVLEVNAFGDLLPNVLHAGQDTHGLLVAAATGREVAPAPRTSPLGPHLPAPGYSPNAT